MFVEVIVTSPEEAELAERCGAHRVEFVRDLAAGGLSPDMEQVALAARRVGIPVNVMIRPRAGVFEYSPGEMDEMKRLSLSALEAGARGLVMGFTRDGGVDLKALEQALSWCPSLDFTFHRAIDQLPDPVSAAEALRDFPGVTDLLTSGGAGPIEGNLDRIRRMAEVLEGVRVMAGGGITQGNVRKVIDRTGVRWVHLGRSVRAGGSPDGPLDEGLLKRMIGLVRG
ncbi:MAG: hypothetical protein N2315_00980 [Thermanaerothrix sp.]|nr:hypothetical protein [Thermanaerothrix sp.]